jgi:hypothetical protein
LIPGRTPDELAAAAERALARLRPAGGDFATWLREEVLRPLGEGIRDLFAPLFRGISSLGGPWMAWGAGVAALLCLLLLLARFLESRGRALVAEAAGPAPPPDGGPDALEAEARRHAAGGRFVEAARLLYAATLRRLHLRDGRPFDPSLTPCEHTAPFRRRPFFPELAAFVRGYEAASFSEGGLDAPGWERLEASRPVEGRP